MKGAVCRVHSHSAGNMPPAHCSSIHCPSCHIAEPISQRTWTGSSPRDPEDGGGEHQHGATDEQIAPSFRFLTDLWHRRARLWTVATFFCVFGVYMYTYSLPGGLQRSSTHNSDYVWFNGMGYYFSKEAMSWTSSRKFCEEQGASLAILRDAGIKDDLKHFMQDSEGQWCGQALVSRELKWLDETTADERSVPLSGPRCAVWSQGDIRLVDCSLPRLFICMKPQEEE